MMETKSICANIETVLSSQVIYSLFMKSENMAGWPRVVADDVIRQAHKLKNEMFVMGGKIKGKTLLPLPEHLDTPDSSADVFER